MNKQTPAAFLIILSILVLSLKDSASLIHTILHYIPNNPWHQHNDTHTGHHHINPLEIHKYLQNKHAYENNHEHAHTHDLMDHIHTDAKNSDKHTTPSEIKIDIKTDCFFQNITTFLLEKNSNALLMQHQSDYHFSISESLLSSPFQPPRA